jgi:hypothetical protein
MVGTVLPDIVLLRAYPDTRRYLLDEETLHAFDWWGLSFASAVIYAAKLVGAKGSVAAGHRVRVATASSSSSRSSTFARFRCPNSSRTIRHRVNKTTWALPSRNPPMGFHALARLTRAPSLSGNAIAHEPRSTNSWIAFSASIPSKLEPRPSKNPRMPGEQAGRANDRAGVGSWNVIPGKPGSRRSHAREGKIAKTGARRWQSSPEWGVGGFVAAVDGAT